MNDNALAERERQAHYGRSQTQNRTAPRPETKRRGHEAVLSAIQNGGKPITVLKMDGSKVFGQLIAHDPYTLTVRADGETTRRVIFKHDISEFYAEEASQA